MEQVQQFLNKICERERSKWVYIGVIGLWILYAVLTFSTPVEDSETLDLSDQEIFYIRLTIIIPYLLIWLAGVFSFLRVINYSSTIEDSKEGKGFYYLGLGILVLLASLVLSSVSSAFDNFVDEGGSLHRAFVIIDNYLYVFPILVAFWLFFLSSRALLRILRQTVPTQAFLIFGAGLLVFAYVWLDLIFTNPTRTTGTADTPASYYLRDSLIVLTIVIPSIAAWVIGIWSALGMNIYRQRVKGTIYRRAFWALAFGISAVILASILLQGLLSLGTERLLGLGLGHLLALIYLFVLAQGLGFLLIALGAKRLTQIETV